MLGKLFGGQAEARDLSFQQIWGSGADVSTLSTWAGTTISSQSSTQIGAVYACVRLLSDTISSLPVDTFVRRDGNRLPFRPRPAWACSPPPWRRT